MVYRSYLDRILYWGMVASLIVAALIPRLMRIDALFASIGWIIAIALCGTLFVCTTQAKPFFEYIKKSYNEWLKINWSSRSETIRLSFIVIVVVAIVSLALSLFDNLLNWLFQLLTK